VDEPEKEKKIQSPLDKKGDCHSKEKNQRGKEGMDKKYFKEKKGWGRRIRSDKKGPP